LDQLGARSVLECSVRGESVFEQELMGATGYYLTRLTRSADGADCAVPFLNPMYSRLPCVDAVVLLDYFDYLNEREVMQVLRRLRRAGIRYVAATQYPCLNSNWDTATGEWRPVNLALHPYGRQECAPPISDPVEGGRSDRSIGIFHL
jgi:hypothetical protein